jgi:hypothetical protein
MAADRRDDYGGDRLRPAPAGKFAAEFDEGGNADGNAVFDHDLSEPGVSHD